MASTGNIDDRLRADRLLLQRYQRTHDPRLRDELIERFLPLARRLARRYERGDEPFEDLVQVASLGLVKALDRFDASREIAFSSYAVPTILGELRRHFRDKTWSVRVPRDLQELVLRVEKALSELNRDLRRSPTVPEIAQHLGVGEEQVLEALEAGGAHRATSLQTPKGDEDGAETLGDGLGDQDHGFALAEHRATLSTLLGALAPREREILRLRFEEDLTQEEIGLRVGVSQMQVSRLIRRSLAQMREVAQNSPT
ncbi:MAG TPA: SigB/SigF/SigG family RNA polymerase sigma factor [Baekduia sp.]|nr:SigB/SigF/SigG family RNA polymerase sigma factor [Baekduia sp.]